ncbi:MAG: EamA family transporter, partial [Chloroflexi bacterium]|nr:EamA family transporter [Chloroflexota bacterium]
MSFFSITLVLISAALHASWNLLVREQRSINMFMGISIVSTFVLSPPLLLWEMFAPPVLSAVPLNILGGGVCLAVYYTGMTHSYRGGDFTVAYPLARALPVLMVACAEVALGDAPTPVGWLGIALIALGSLILPLQSLSDLNAARYWNRTTVWILMAATSIAAYTVIDRNALRQLPNGLTFAMRYGVLETLVGGIIYWVVLRVTRETIVLPARLAAWKLPTLATLFLFGSYSLILWAFQSDDRASYVIGLRQISIVLGVVVGAYVFHERGAR